MPVGLLLTLAIAVEVGATISLRASDGFIVPMTIQSHVDGAYVLGAVRSLGKFHRVQGSPGFRAAADWLVGELQGRGLADAAVEHLPADGKTRYGHFRSYLGWTASEGRLEEVVPRLRKLGDFAAQPVALADYSQDADVSAELVDVGAGADAAAYQGVEVRGKLVLADGPLPVVHRLAVEERGAAGIVSDFPNQRTAWSGLDPDLVRWGHLSPYQTANRFAFMISPRTAGELRRELAHGAVRLSAHVKARMVPASFDVVSAARRPARTWQVNVLSSIDVFGSPDSAMRSLIESPVTPCSEVV